MSDLRETKGGFVMIKCVFLCVPMYIVMRERGFKTTSKSFLKKVVYFFLIFFIDFREEGRGRDRNINDDRELLIGCLLLTPSGVLACTRGINQRPPTSSYVYAQ